MNRDGQLTPEDVAAVESWVTPVAERLRRFPELPSSVDLVIEGGVGNGTTMSHIVRRLFPRALYIGTDLSPQLMAGKRRLRGQVDDEILQELVSANSRSARDLEKVVIYANCFDSGLIHDIMRKSGRAIPFLVSYNAIGSLADRKMNMLERKEGEDNIPISRWFAPELPYIGQAHIINYGLDWEIDRPPTIFDHKMREVATEAEQNGYAVERMDIGVIIVKT